MINQTKTKKIKIIKTFNEFKFFLTIKFDRCLFYTLI